MASSEVSNRGLELEMELLHSLFVDTIANSSRFQRRYIVKCFSTKIVSSDT